MIKNGGNLFWFCSSYFLRRHSGKLKYSSSGKRLHRRGLAHSLSEVMFNASSAAFSCIRLQRTPGKETPAVVQTRHLLAC